MIRAIAFVTCLIAGLFLVPVQGECSEILEQGPETEAVCCSVSYLMTQPDLSAAVPAVSHRQSFIKVRRTLSINEWSVALTLPARILHCVFRE